MLTYHREVSMAIHIKSSSAQQQMSTKQKIMKGVFCGLNYGTCREQLLCQRMDYLLFGTVLDCRRDFVRVVENLP